MNLTYLTNHTDLTTLTGLTDLTCKGRKGVRAACGQGARESKRYSGDVFPHAGPKERGIALVDGFFVVVAVLVLVRTKGRATC